MDKRAAGGNLNSPATTFSETRQPEHGSLPSPRAAWANCLFSSCKALIRVSTELLTVIRVK
jgi:hypothetical protein